jgi:hypothetical protein
VVSARDGAGRLLALAVRLLPPARRPWGAAMQAELAAIESAGQRWRFAAGCVRVVVTRPAVLRRVGYPLLMAGVLAVTLWWTSRIGYPPFRWGLVSVVAVQLVLAALGRVRGPLGPVGEGWTARVVRAGGYLLLTAWTVSLTAFMLTQDPGEMAGGMPIFGLLLTSYLIGALTLTAQRSAATRRVLIAGVGGGGAAATLFTVGAFVTPPIPADLTPALELLALAMLAAAAAARTGGAQRSLLAALCAGTVAAILIGTALMLLSTYAPPSLIPDLAPAALSRADDLAQSRQELQDPYLWLLLLGAVTAVAQSIAARPTVHGVPQHNTDTPRP